LVINKVTSNQIKCVG